MGETLTEKIVTPRMDLARALTAWAWDHPDPSLASLEEAVLTESPGSRWSEAGAKAVLILRAHLLSHPCMAA